MADTSPKRRGTSIFVLFGLILVAAVAAFFLLQPGPPPATVSLAVLADRAMNIATLSDLTGATVCVEKAKESELIAAFKVRAVTVTLKPVDTLAVAVEMYLNAGCDAVAADAAGIEAALKAQSTPDTHIVLTL